MPEVLLDGILCERFHITPSQLDREDSARLIPMVAALNIHAGLRRVMVDFMRTKIPPSAEDMALYGAVINDVQ